MWTEGRRKKKPPPRWRGQQLRPAAQSSVGAAQSLKRGKAPSPRSARLVPRQSSRAASSSEQLKCGCTFLTWCRHSSTSPREPAAARSLPLAARAPKWRGSSWRAWSSCSSASVPLPMRASTSASWYRASAKPGSSSTMDRPARSASASRPSSSSARVLVICCCSFSSGCHSRDAHTRLSTSFASAALRGVRSRSKRASRCSGRSPRHRMCVQSSSLCLCLLPLPTMALRMYVARSPSSGARTCSPRRSRPSSPRRSSSSGIASTGRAVHLPSPRCQAQSPLHEESCSSGQEAQAGASWPPQPTPPSETEGSRRSSLAAGSARRVRPHPMASRSCGTSKGA
mmetsp:Transcript_49081/g.130273  ORF Transcript_49081/g.130273 Transcript_49081/m.130273 type:complete len:341 (+) Transcript_49081:174-1196(+)